MDIPCNITPKIATDSVTLVLWYKTPNATGPPLYSIDMRSQSEVEHVAADDYKERASFNLTAQPVALLSLDPVRVSDTGWFSCRVDFKWSRTVLQNALLHVIGE